MRMRQIKLRWAMSMVLVISLALGFLKAALYSWEESSTRTILVVVDAGLLSAIAPILAYRFARFWFGGERADGMIQGPVGKLFVILNFCLILTFVCIVLDWIASFDKLGTLPPGTPSF
jgi:hypothetical protein